MTLPRSAQLIDELSADLEPVRRPAGTGAASAVWLVVAWGIVLALVGIAGPFRSGIGAQLLAAPLFALESALGLGLGGVAVAGAFALGTPGERSRQLVRALLILAGGWVALLAFGLLVPALTPSTAGMRSSCDLQILLFALLPLGVGLWALRRRAVLDRRLAGLCLGVAAGSLPAVAMQWACMYDPAHALVSHLGPGALVAAVGALAGSRLLPRL